MNDDLILGEEETFSQVIRREKGSDGSIWVTTTQFQAKPLFKWREDGSKDIYDFIDMGPIIINTEMIPTNLASWKTTMDRQLKEKEKKNE